MFLLNIQSRARQEDPEQARLKQKAKEVCLAFLHQVINTQNNERSIYQPSQSFLSNHTCNLYRVENKSVLFSM